VEPDIRMVVQPTAHSCPMLRRDVLPNAGNMWAEHAVEDRPGMLMVPVWVDVGGGQSQSILG
jgi:hypothetical protein